MDGPSGDQYRRTAGERSGTPGDPHPEIRDWQKNTWYGPAPVHSNPFDEPEDAPELRDSRSDNVNAHLGDFWNGAQDGYGFAGDQRSKSIDGRREQRQKEKHRKNRKVVLAVIGGFLLATALLLRFAIFTVREVCVTGNAQIPDAEILRVCAIHPGDNILTLSEDTVEQKIESNSELRSKIIFRYLDKQFPSTVVIGVKEREACCWFTYCGILYVTDKNLMVMYESEDPNLKPKLVRVTGLDIRSGTRKGQVIVLNSGSQQAAFSELFLEMKVLGCTEEIEEADLSNTDSILLVTRDGFTVSLGNAENIHAKLRSLLLTRAELQKMGKLGGTITVTNPEVPVYTPGTANP